MGVEPGKGRGEARLHRVTPTLNPRLGAHSLTEREVGLLSNSHYAVHDDNMYVWYSN